MIEDFLKFHNIPYPPHIAGWVEMEHVRVIRFKGDMTKATIPKALAFRNQMFRAGLPIKNVILDGSKITAVDSSTVAALVFDAKTIKQQKIGLINVPENLKAYFEILHQQNKIEIFPSEQAAVEALNKRDSDYLPVVSNTLKKNKSLSLLVSLIMFLIALPFFETNMTGIIYLVFFAGVLLTGIYAVSSKISHVASGVLLATPTFITAWSNIFIKDQRILNAEMIFLTIFLVYTMCVILQHILLVKKVTVNELFGAMAVYIMVGMTFGVIYALLESLAPGSLGFPPEEKTPATMTAFYYFSFVSMSSTGFSGIIAISPLARSIVIIQVIIGVMYVSALIGKLVGANTTKEEEPLDELAIKLQPDFWSHDLVGDFFRDRKFLLVLSMTMVNYSFSAFMTVLKLPFFLDSCGTSLAVILGGFPAGMISGIIYNLAMAWTFWDPTDWVWMFCNIVIAFLTWIFFQAGWIDLRQPGKLLGAGVITGVINSFVVAIITWAAHLPVYKGTMVVYHFFLNITNNSVVASMAEKIAVEVADKTISLLLVAVATIFIRELFSQSKRTVPEPA